MTQVILIVGVMFHIKKKNNKHLVEIITISLIVYFLNALRISCVRTLAAVQFK